MFVLRYLQVVGLAPGPLLTVGPGAQPVWPGIDVMTVLVVPWLQQDMARMVAWYESFFLRKLAAKCLQAMQELVCYHLSSSAYQRFVHFQTVQHMACETRRFGKRETGS